MHSPQKHRLATEPVSMFKTAAFKYSESELQVKGDLLKAKAVDKVKLMSEIWHMGQ